MRLAYFSLLLLASPAFAQPKLSADLVAPTDALSPADERKAFTLPAGFDVQLVASEPDIQKPMQMAWDAKGRLWVTTSYHYPFAAPHGKGTDKVFILSDFDPATGKAGKVQTFASDLNIPIGVLPLPDCKSCIVSSVGEIRKYFDADGDGKAEKFEVLFSGFGTRDTHGMTNSFTLMPDGWVYACHGFANESTVKGKDGHEVMMKSGHTFRFRPDGSRIEIYTRGQVNPFGIAVDPWFNLYTADCHSKPITQLIPGAYYESFGKPHDGLGFAPHVTRHDHGSTGLCGLAWYDADQFPKDYLGCMFVGNVVTNRINFDKIEWKGASPVAKELPDFLVSSDRWFRPVDIKLGPDGALYVADFYNKIIGHYEVPLTYPGRDKDRGRLWRIVWTGKDAKPPKMAFADLTKEDVREAYQLLDSSNIAVRLLVTNQLIHRSEDMSKALKSGIKTRTSFSDRGFAHGAWRGNSQSIDSAGVTGALTTFKQHRTPFSIAHELKMAGVESKWDEKLRVAVIACLKDEPIVQRAGVEAIAAHAHADFVAPLVELLKKCPGDDTHLRYAARVALRNCLRDADAWPKEFDAVYAEMALAIPTEKAAAYLASQIVEQKLPSDRLVAAAEFIARNGDSQELGPTLRWLTGGDITPLHGDAILGVFRGLQARGKKLEGMHTDMVRIAMDRELGRTIPAGGPQQPDNVRRLISVTRVLAALPGIVKDWNATLLPAKTVNALAELVKQSAMPVDLRVAAADALIRIAPSNSIAALRRLVADPMTPADVVDRLLLVFAASNNKDARLDARDSLKDAPYRTAVAVGTALAGTPGGAEDLLGAVKMGKAPARLLQEKVILERLRAANIADLDKQVAALTKGLPPLDQKLAELIKKRSAAFVSAKPDKELGTKLFVKHCGACHRIGDQGGKIAPQLDGIGTRGLERVLEDTLDPNRNVDQAFRARIITTKDEKSITGLMLRVEGAVLVVADAEGKEIRIPTKDIDTNRETMLSPMPANFGDTIPEAEFAHLVAYLLDQKAQMPPKK